MVFIWPAIVIILLAFFRLYDVIFSCNSGFFIGGCLLGKWFLSVLVLESLFVYAIFSFFVYFLLKQLQKKYTKLISIFLGLLSLSIVFGSVFLVVPVLFRLFMLPVFYGMDFISKAKVPLPPSLIRDYGAGFTVWQKFIKLFLFPFFPDYDI